METEIFQHTLTTSEIMKLSHKAKEGVMEMFPAEHLCAMWRVSPPAASSNTWSRIR